MEHSLDLGYITGQQQDINNKRISYIQICNLDQILLTVTLNHD